MEDQAPKKGKQGRTQMLFFVFLFFFILLPTGLSVYLCKMVFDLKVEVSSNEKALQQVETELSQVPKLSQKLEGTIEWEAGGTEVQMQDWVLRADGEQAAEVQGQKVYLTFDDGPSECTDGILDILAKYQVKATFFVVGQEDAASLACYRRIVEEGHTLGMHSYSHDYDAIYASVDAFAKDYMKLRLLLYETTGVMPMVYRFPGGSSNAVSSLPMQEFIAYLDGQGIVYYDWNAANGDALGGQQLSVGELTSNVVASVGNQERAVVLMHDAPRYKNTVEALPGVIEALQAKQAELLPITIEETAPIQHVSSMSAMKQAAP